MVECYAVIIYKSLAYDLHMFKVIFHALTIYILNERLTYNKSCYFLYILYLAQEVKEKESLPSVISLGDVKEAVKKSGFVKWQVRERETCISAQTKS